MCPELNFYVISLSYAPEIVLYQETFFQIILGLNLLGINYLRSDSVPKVLIPINKVNLDLVLFSPLGSLFS